VSGLAVGGGGSVHQGGKGETGAKRQTSPPHCSQLMKGGAIIACSAPRRAGSGTRRDATCIAPPDEADIGKDGPRFGSTSGRGFL
jgi:hypothetical protein